MSVREDLPTPGHRERPGQWRRDPHRVSQRRHLAVDGAAACVRTSPRKWRAEVPPQPSPSDPREREVALPRHPGPVWEPRSETPPTPHQTASWRARRQRSRRRKTRRPLRRRDAESCAESENRSLSRYATGLWYLYLWLRPRLRLRLCLRPRLRPRLRPCLRLRPRLLLVPRLWS